MHTLSHIQSVFLPARTLSKIYGLYKLHIEDGMQTQNIAFVVMDSIKQLVYHIYSINIHTRIQSVLTPARTLYLYPRTLSRIQSVLTPARTLCICTRAHSLAHKVYSNRAHMLVYKVYFYTHTLCIIIARTQFLAYNVYLYQRSCSHKKCIYPRSDVYLCTHSRIQNLYPCARTLAKKCIYPHTLVHSHIQSVCISARTLANKVYLPACTHLHTQCNYYRAHSHTKCIYTCAHPRIQSVGAHISHTKCINYRMHSHIQSVFITVHTLSHTTESVFITRS